MEMIKGNSAKKLLAAAGILFSVSLTAFLLMASPTLAAEETYVSGEDITVHLLLDVNNNVPAQVQVMIYNPENHLIGNSTHDINLNAGKNDINLTVPFQTDKEGLHYLRYDIFAVLEGASTLIVSSTQYFDAEKNDPPSIKLLAPENGGVFSSGETIEFRAEVTDPENQDVTVTWASDLSGPIGTGTSFNKALEAGVHRITITAEDELGDKRTRSFTVNVVKNSVQVEIAPGKAVTLPLALVDTKASRPSLELPEGFSLNVQASEVQAPAKGAVGPVIDFTANVSSFEAPVKITLGYNTSQVPDPSKLKLAWYDGTTKKWVIVKDSTVDTKAHTVSGYVSHFTPFAPILETTEDESSKSGSSGGSGGFISKLKEAFETENETQSSEPVKIESTPTGTEETPKEDNVGAEVEKEPASEEKTPWLPGFGSGLAICLISVAYLALRRRE